ncbi:MAG: hypothetical protein RL637_763 [Pseudomonadota bacterium]|jgi:tRNA-dihydrouridine synthase B
MLTIGQYRLANRFILAPMAGITDLPFRQLCYQLGAGLTVSEMLTSDPHLRHHRRTQYKARQDAYPSLRSVQILGTDPRKMAEAASFNQQQGADIIDINMGCPAKKVCAVAAGSALLKQEKLVAEILQAVVQAVTIPVTLKIRTGWDQDQRNAATIAHLAEQAGISALTIHGRTRACQFRGQAEYETIKQVKQQVSLPIIANGDITSAEKAAAVLTYTAADAVMIGRAAQGQPWIFQQFQHYFAPHSPPIDHSLAAVYPFILQHLIAIYQFYGEKLAIGIARKHIAWYLQRFHLTAFKSQIFAATQTSIQFQLMEQILFQAINHHKENLT